ncbi:hypothetical protein Pint_30132 [Pistacia integerrima]|uniref:Uncharacterized protein n=1 Tax=Pistacia integerrima TaxID=434235 RepID=A0ACC0X058_9ROSI|nr:hypothetical protein Pint_30132 [Pistacia integerrima]
MGRSLISFSNIPLKISHIPRSFLPFNHSNQCPFLKSYDKSSSGYKKVSVLSTKPGRKLCTKAMLSETSYRKEYPKIGAKSTGLIPPNELIQVVEIIVAKTRAEALSVSFRGYSANFFELPLLVFLFYFFTIFDR